MRPLVKRQDNQWIVLCELCVSFYQLWPMQAFYLTPQSVISNNRCFVFFSSKSKGTGNHHEVLTVIRFMKLIIGETTTSSSYALYVKTSHSFH